MHKGVQRSTEEYRGVQRCIGQFVTCLGTAFILGVILEELLTDYVCCCYLLLWFCFKVLDVGHNQLLNVSVTNLMASQIDMLDMSLNSQLRVNPREFRTIK